MSLRLRPEIEALPIGVHGGPNHAELRAMGLDPGAIIDFSVCTNPFMPPPGIRKVLNTVAIARYPDSQSTEFRERLAEQLDIRPDNIIAGSGTTELIRLIALAYLGHGDTVLIPEPTFGDYEIAARIAGAQPVKPLAEEKDGFVPRIDKTVELIREHRPRAVFICNPNNPTGKYLSQAQVEAILKALGDGILVLDEAYVSFVQPRWPATGLIHQGNVVILRSMTKDYGLAGLRLGYAVAGSDIIASLLRACPPWNVNAFAQKIGTACLERADYLNQTLRRVRQARDFLLTGFARLGFATLPSDANFFLVKVGNARGFRAALLKQGMMVRDCTSFGLPEHVRIAPRTRPECRKLLNAISSLLEKGDLT